MTFEIFVRIMKGVNGYMHDRNSFAPDFCGQSGKERLPRTGWPRNADNYSLLALRSIKRTHGFQKIERKRFFLTRKLGNIYFLISNNDPVGKGSFAHNRGAENRTRALSFQLSVGVPRIGLGAHAPH